MTEVEFGEDQTIRVRRVMDALLALGHVVASLSDDERTAQLLDDALSQDPADLNVLVERLLAEDLPLPVGLLDRALAKWFDDGQELWRWLSVWGLRWPVAGPQADELSDALTDALDALADVNDAAPAEAPELARHLAVVAGLVTEPKAALATALAALNFVARMDGPDVLAVADVALRVARTAEDTNGILLAQLRRALALAPRYATEPSIRVEAYEAFETVVRYLGASPTLRQALVPIRHWVTQIADMRPLAAIVLATDPPSDPGELAGELAALAVTATPCWELETPQLAGLPWLLRTWIEAENAKLALEDRPDAHAAEASWDTWAIDHPAFRRSIPHGESMLREVDLDETLLILHHEATHVLSMLSGVGLTLTALRAAIFESELDLWTLLPNPSGEQLEAGVGATPPPGSVLGLAESEQMLELRRKEQIIQNAWGPILEGVAVYGELCADPREPDEYAAPIAYIVANLVDVELTGAAEAAGLSPEDMQRRLLAEAEARFGEAQERVGQLRLRAYMERAHHKYLAGYLAVRRIVAGWRSRLGGDLAGATAFRLLLHALRTTSTSAVPRLDAPLGTFADDTLAGMMGWLGSLAELDVGALRALVANEARLTIDGTELVIADVQDPDLEQREVERRFAEARRALAGDDADLTRVAGADPVLQHLLAEIAGSLSLQPTAPSALVQHFLGHALSTPALMPIGHSTAPFWLNRPTSSLVCILRTTENDYQHGGSSYQILANPLSPSQFEQLERVMLAQAATRLKVTRFADLVDRNEADSGRLVGSNYVAFSLGDWGCALTRGWLIGKSSAPALVETLAAQRAQPNAAAVIEQRLRQDRGSVAATRMLDWLDGPHRWITDGTELPLAPWADHVSALAAEVLAGASDFADQRAELALLTWCVGDSERAAQLAANGLYDLDGGALGQVLRALQATGSHPAESPWLDEHEDEVREVLGPVFQRSPRGWDVSSP